MTEVMLDTSAYIFLQKGHAGILDAVRGAFQVWLNPIVLGELLSAYAGRKEGRKNEMYLRRFLSHAATQMADINEETAVRYASLTRALQASGTPVGANDVWIAASAMQHGLVLLTTDADFEKIPQIFVRRFEV